MTSLVISQVAIRKLILASLYLFIFFRLLIPFVSSFADTMAIVDLLFDDAYYYLAVAYNIAHHGISSFDRITQTNGYQPLWLILLASFETLLQLERKEFFIFTLVLVSILTVVPLLYLAKKRSDPFALALLAGLLASYSCYPFVWLLGLETVLFAPLFLLVVLAIKKHGFIESQQTVSWLFALIVLVRLDAVSILLAYSCLLFFAMQSRAALWSSVKRILSFIVPSMLALIVFFGINKSLFDTYVPVSGTAKMIGAPVFSNWGIAFYYLFNAPFFLLPLFLLLVAEWFWGKFRHGAFFYFGILVLAGSSLIQYLFYAIFSGWMVWPWYFYQYALILVLVMARLIMLLYSFSTESNHLVGKNIISISALFFVIIIPVLFNSAMLGYIGFVQFYPERSGFTFNQRNLAYINEFLNTHDQLTILMGDRAGGLGYWAPDNIHVFQIEGLVADKDYLEARRRGDAHEWIASRIQPQYLVVDRENIPVIDHDGQRYYILVEPIQGRVVFEYLLYFCFREDALIYHDEILVDHPTWLVPNARRYVFDVTRVESCAGNFYGYINQLVYGLESPRRQALPVEYDGYWLNSAMEEFDRARALKLNRH